MPLVTYMCLAVSCDQSIVDVWCLLRMGQNVMPLAMRKEYQNPMKGYTAIVPYSHGCTLRNGSLGDWIVMRTSWSALTQTCEVGQSLAMAS
jgi:hypothetical protein